MTTGYRWRPGDPPWDGHKARWEDPEERQRASDAAKARWANKEERERQAAAKRAWWAVPENRAKMMAARRRKELEELL